MRTRLRCTSRSPLSRNAGSREIGGCCGREIERRERDGGYVSDREKVSEFNVHYFKNFLWNYDRVISVLLETHD